MTSLAKLVVSLLRPLLPYIHHLPTPLLTLLPTLALHLTTNPYPTPLSLLKDPLTDPLHLPFLTFLGSVPFFYTLGLVTGNVSWVDRSWPFYTPLMSGLVVGWVGLNSKAGVYGHNLARLGVVLGLQFIWSARLLTHAIKRDFYDLTSEDYRYTQFKKLIPRWLFNIVHPIVIAFAQPLLLFSLCLPLHAILLLPPTELSAGPLPSLSIPYSAMLPFLPERFHTSPPSTPILNVADYVLVVAALSLIYLEASADRKMQEYQNAKHSTKTDMITPPASNTPSWGPRPAPYPRKYHPGFPTQGLYRWSRHPNFAAEQLFWATQALFVVAAGRSSGVTRSGWITGTVFGPCFALSILFCGSTFLTEWITTRKYPVYSSYKRLVGQFVPQETALIWMWGVLTRTRKGAERMVYGRPGQSS